MLLAGRSPTRPSTLAPEDCDDAAWIAQRMVLDAGAQAARLRRQASVQADAIRDAAERETELVWRQASVQADALREAAEREAARLRAIVMKLSAGPGELVNVDGQEVFRPVGKPGTRTAAKPGPRTAARPATKREAKPGTRLGAVPGTRPARSPQGPTRQLVAFRVATAATATLLTFAVVGAAVEVKTFGFPFFVFRTAVGESGPGVPTDQQFLAQEAAAGVHRHNDATTTAEAKTTAAKTTAAKTTAAKTTAHKARRPGRHPAKTTPGS
jgi:hypothetical protein